MKDPAVLLYIDSWRTSTTEMDAITRAYYMDLLLHQYDKGSLPNDIEELANICRVRFSEFEQFKQVFEQVLKQVFEQISELYINGDEDENKDINKEKTNFEIILDEWFDYKKKRGQSYKSEKSKQLLATKLKELSGGDDLKARKIIEQSMLNNWAGIFQLKTDKPTHAITDYQQQNSNIDKW